MDRFEVFFPGGKKVAANYRGFTITTDQPRFGGGEDSAPSPFELFLASLATCAGFYVLSFCDQRGIPTEGIRLSQEMQVDPRTHMIANVAIRIELPEGFPEQYREAVVRAAETCTVKKHLQFPPAIEVYASTARVPAGAGA